MTVEMNVACAICGDNHPFDMPPELLKAALSNDLVIFAGAGVSTESRRVFPDTLAERTAAELGRAPKGGDASFPQLMSEYESKSGRTQLLLRIRERFDYMKGFPELLTIATRFHSELATAFFLDTIVTTNWDTYFEEYAGATPIVIPHDYAFWSLEGRKVFKLHGSMHNLSTLVITQRDYDRCYRRLQSGVIGSSLKHLLATKRVVFIGYSFGDPDLDRILRFMRQELRDVLPRSFVVTPHDFGGRDFPPERVLRTDGTFFIQKLKDAAIDLGLMRHDAIYSRAERLSQRVLRAQRRVTRTYSAKATPSVIHTLAYQDGLRDGLDRIVALRSSGHYSNPHSTHGKLLAYERLIREARRTRHYFHAAYLEGYLNGLITLELGEKEVATLPLYFVWGSKLDLRTFEEFASELERASNLHKGAAREAGRLARDLSDDLIVYHRPFLLSEASV